MWIVHGEGRAHFPCAAVKARILEADLAPLRYTDDSGAQTEAYPFNPNGSPEGIAALTSPCGRCGKLAPNLTFRHHPRPYPHPYPHPITLTLSPYSSHSTTLQLSPYHPITLTGTSR